MKRLSVLVIGLFLSLITQSQAVADISAAEYFVDSDPGPGNGISLSIATGATVNFIANIPTSSLSQGFHNVFIRSKDLSGKWGQFESRGFYISTQTNTGAIISSAEYYFDSDPGFGNGIPLTIGSGGSTVNFIANISTGVLTPGFHNLYIRTKDGAGTGGLFESRSFYISAHAGIVTDIIAAEYFYDTDPGAGNGTPLSVTLLAGIYKDSLVLPIGSLPLGDHGFSIRVKNADGHWSLLESKLFNVCTRYGPKSITNFHVETNRVFFTNTSRDADTTLWKFGDGTTDTVFHPIKTYTAAGNYNVQLISKNLCGKDTLNMLIPITGIQSINASKGGNIGVSTVIFEGNGFTTTTILKLIKGSTVLLPADKQFISSRRIVGYFSLGGADTGRYHVTADLGGGVLDTLKNGFLISPGRFPSVAIAGVGGRNPARFGFMYRNYTMQNKGNEDAIMVAFASALGYRPNTINISSSEEFVNLTTQGIFQNTYQYLTANSISADVMSSKDIDTIRKKQILAYYRVKVPAESYVNNYARIANTFGLLEYDNGFITHPPLFKSTLVLNDISSPNGRDCMNSFLKKAVKKNITVTVNAAAWDNCFNTAFDTLARSLRDIVKDISQQQKCVPMKSVYSALLVQMLQCGSSGMPATVTTSQFEKIIKDVTYNWLLLENLDSIGRPCFDTTETYVFNRSNIHSIPQPPVSGFTASTASASCPGAIFFPELAEQCKDFGNPCDAAADMAFKDNDLASKVGRFVFKKAIGALTGPGGSGGLCNVNSGAIGCKRLCELTSVDPNVKFGPGNNDDLKHVNSVGNYDYTVFFENLPSATAPAAYVEITDTLDVTKLDIKTFQTGSFGWGDSAVLPDANRGNYSLLKDLRPAFPNKLRVDVRLDTLTGIVKWKFSTLDTTTLQLSDDPAHGFLPPNTDGKRGVGFVSFSIKPKAGVVSGTVINNKASIVFDQNAPIITPIWQHIIDTTKPQSQVAALPAAVNTANFVVNWGGSDAHAGIDKYAVYVSVNDSLFKQWQKFTTAVSDTFHGQFGKTYKFFSIAKDKAKNYEDAPPDPSATPDAVTTPQGVVPVTLLSFNAKKSADGKKADLQWETKTEQQVSHFEIQRSGNGVHFAGFTRVNAVNSINGSTYTKQDISPLSKINYYRLKIVDTDGSFSLSPVRTVRFDDKEEILVYPTLTSSLVIVQTEKEISAELRNVNGILLKEKVIKGTGSFDLSALPSGIYFIRAGDAKKSFKIIKQ